MSKSRFYKTWGGMHYRCRSKQKGYTNVKVCKEWNSFEVFHKDMFIDYEKHIEEYGERNTTIDRIDSKKGYSVKNCRWATYKIQADNTKYVHMVTIEGKTLPLKDWAKIKNIQRSTVYHRLSRGWSDIQALTYPKRVAKNS